ncbi:MAG: 2-isopropylmalate synthase [Candidatus Marinimicrobia bacterium]|nr:2-isopropylmalate synthase [Candidatus Neomarinimicrobiota bacterium]
MGEQDNRIIIFDTTLRDGEQSPGASLNVPEKVEIARQLDLLGVDVIEAGFPVSSPVQFEAVERVVDCVNTVVAGLARAVTGDIDAAYGALKNGDRFRIHIFIGTSDIHISEKFRDNRYGVSLKDKRVSILRMATEAVAYAKTFTDDVEFSAEDAGRTEVGYLAEVIEATIEAGATTVNIPDTTGFTMPVEFGAKISELRRRVSNIGQAVISVHCHNDLGLAVANSLSAIQNGARQVEGTINGIGERAGNAALEEIVMALKVREDLWEFTTGINLKEIYNTSRMVSAFTGIVVQPNKAIVGDNAFAHEAGIHQDGVLKNRRTYEIMTAESVGVSKTNIVLGRHSGRHGLTVRLKELGYHVSDEELDQVYSAFVELADKKKEVFDDDLRVLMGDEIYRRQEYYQLESFHVSAGTTTPATATVLIKVNDQLHQESAIGDGPVDACFQAINRALDVHTKIESYQVRSVTAGRDAQGEVIVRIREDGRAFTGRGVSTDIIEASVKAYLQTLNDQRTALMETEQTEQTEKQKPELQATDR